jgi:hypothetical protein
VQLVLILKLQDLLVPLAQLVQLVQQVQQETLVLQEQQVPQVLQEPQALYQHNLLLFLAQQDQQDLRVLQQ